LIAERSAIRKVGKEAKAGVKEPSLIELVGRALGETLG